MSNDELPSSRWKIKNHALTKCSLGHFNFAKKVFTLAAAPSPKRQRGPGPMCPTGAVGCGPGSGWGTCGAQIRISIWQKSAKISEIFGEKIVIREHYALLSTVLVGSVWVKKYTKINIEKRKSG